MAETFGSLCDKLTIVKLKQFHGDDPKKLGSLACQEKQLIDEIDGFVVAAIRGELPPSVLEFPANKIFNSKIGPVQEFKGGIGDVFAALAEINCKLWHEQEKVYDFESVPADQKNSVVKKLGVLNLERTRCIDELNHLLAEKVRHK